MTTYLKPLLLCCFALFLLQCSNSDDSGSPGTSSAPATPNIDVAAFSGKCLDLQKTAAHLNTGTFSYPALRYTRDYKILAGSPSGERQKTLYARNLQTKHFTLTSLSEFRDATQTGCDTVQIPISGNIVATYKIVSFTPKTLRLEFVPFTEPMIPGRTQGSRFVEAMKKFAINTAFQIELVSPRELVITSQYQLATYSCNDNEKLSVSDTQVLVWEENAKALPTTVKLDSAYYTKLNILFPEFFAVPNPASTREEETSAPVAQPASPSLIEINAQTIDQFAAQSYLAESSCAF